MKAEEITERIKKKFKDEMATAYGIKLPDGDMKMGAVIPSIFAAVGEVVAEITEQDMDNAEVDYE